MFKALASTLGTTPFHMLVFAIAVAMVALGIYAFWAADKTVQQAQQPPDLWPGLGEFCAGLLCLATAAVVLGVGLSVS